MWQEISKMQWGKFSKEHRGYNDVKQKMLKQYSQEFCKEIHEFASERMQDVMVEMSNYEAINGVRCFDGGDDATSDVCYHVVGLGEKMFKKVLSNPELLKNIDYVESFSYCFPRSSDYEKIESEYFDKKAVDCLTELARILHENKPDEKDTLIICELIRRFTYILEGRYVAATHKIDEWYDEFYEFEANDVCAKFSNVLHDCKQFQVK